MGNHWLEYIQERFAFYLYLPAIFLFTFANIVVAQHAMQQDPQILNILVAFALATCFFFRLQLFIEIRDYRSDLKWNPLKPLPRGLITVKQATNVAFSLILVELLLASFIGRNSFAAHLLPVAWSLLMFADFFAPKLLGRHPTVYAMLRSVVFALAGYSMGVTAIGQSLLDFPLSFFIFGIANWALFNVYEFSNHIYLEKKGLNYLELWGNWGLTGLILSQMVIAAFVGNNIWLWVGMLPIVLILATKQQRYIKLSCLYYMLFFYGIISL